MAHKSASQYQSDLPQFSTTHLITLLICCPGRMTICLKLNFSVLLSSLSFSFDVISFYVISSSPLLLAAKFFPFLKLQFSIPTFNIYFLYLAVLEYFLPFKISSCGGFSSIKEINPDNMLVHLHLLQVFYSSVLHCFCLFGPVMNWMIQMHHTPRTC